MNKSLNVRQERFCEFVAAGDSQTEAYIKAGFKTDRTNARKHAAALMTKHDISARIAELRKPQTKAALLKKEDNLRFLALIIQTPLSQINPDSPLCAEYTEEVVVGQMRKKRKGTKLASGYENADETVIRRKIKKHDTLRAIEIYAKLAGYFAPEKIEIENQKSRLESIKERAAHIQSALALQYQVTPSAKTSDEVSPPKLPEPEAPQASEIEPVPQLDNALCCPAWERWA